MAAPTTSNLGDLLARLIRKDEPIDDASRAVLQRMNETDQRIADIRENVQRGIRKREGRFRL
jgi:ABC-type transporter Mla subunit MlaD